MINNSSSAGIGWVVGRHGLELGNAVDTRQRVRLGLPWLDSGVHILGPTGSGKTRLLLHLFAQLSTLPKSTVVLFNPKGRLGAMARDFAISHGLTGRLSVFDPSDPELLPGFNPLRRNGLSVATQAKAVREAILAGHGQTDIDRTQQLARHLLLALYVALERGLTLLEAATLLRSRSLLRAALLSDVVDPVVRDALDHFHRQRPERQDELAASTLARLEAALTDPLLRRILTEPGGLDLGEIIREHRILIVDIRQYQPFRPTDVKFLGRLLLNDLLAHVFERPVNADPVYLLIDEVEMFATEDLCRAFDQGRELGLRTIVAHQHLDQLSLEDGDERLRSSVMTDARTKIVFGGLPVPQLRELIPDLYLGEFNPLAVKDELTTLECEPVETVRAVLAFGVGGGKSATSGANETKGETNALALSRAEALTTMRGTAHSSGYADSAFGGHSTTVLPTGEVMISDTTSGGGGTSDVTSESLLSGATETEARTTTWTTSQTYGESRSTGTNNSVSATVTLTPFHEYRKRRVPSSRTFWTEQEFLTERIKDVSGLPRGSFVVKVPTKPAVRVRAPFVPEPRVRAAMLAAARTRLASLLSYVPPAIPIPSHTHLVEYKHTPNGDDDHATTVPRRRSARRRS
jgi:hypothetical protein